MTHHKNKQQANCPTCKKPMEDKNLVMHHNCLSPEMTEAMTDKFNANRSCGKPPREVGYRVNHDNFKVEEAYSQGWDDCYNYLINKNKQSPTKPQGDL